MNYEDSSFYVLATWITWMANTGYMNHMYKELTWTFGLLLTLWNLTENDTKTSWKIPIHKRSLWAIYWIFNKYKLSPFSNHSDFHIKLMLMYWQNTSSIKWPTGLTLNNLIWVKTNIQISWIDSNKAWSKQAGSTGKLPMNLIFIKYN